MLPRTVSCIGAVPREMSMPVWSGDRSINSVGSTKDNCHEPGFGSCMAGQATHSNRDSGKSWRKDEPSFSRASHTGEGASQVLGPLLSWNCTATGGLQTKCTSYYHRGDEVWGYCGGGIGKLTSNGRGVPCPLGTSCFWGCPRRTAFPPRPWRGPQPPTCLPSCRCFTSVTSP